MSYCPTCQATFDGDEVFCAHDGTRLVAEQSFQPGRLAGSSLAGVVNLEVFLFSDHLGERYRGRLLSDNTEVRVVVFHRNFDAARIKSAQRLIAELGSSLPPELLSLHSIGDGSEPLFLIEEQAERDSLAYLLKKKGTLPWRQALHLAIRLARILDWLASHGVAHRSLHPQSIFVDNPTTASIQVGELAIGLLSFPLPPLEPDTPTDAIPVYPGFLAPEWFEEESKVDLATAATYSIGAVLLAALGHPLFDDAKNLSDFVHAKEQRRIELSLDDAPPALEDLVNLMVAPQPNKRFQSPLAAVAALSNLLDLNPEEVAPPLIARVAPTFDSDDRPITGPVPLPDHEEGSEPIVDVSTKTQLGLPAQAMARNSEDDDEVPAGQSPRVTTESHDHHEEPETSEKKTLMMGAISVEEIAAKSFTSAEDDDQTQDDVVENTKEIEEDDDVKEEQTSEESKSEGVSEGTQRQHAVVVDNEIDNEDEAESALMSGESDVAESRSEDAQEGTDEASIIVAEDAKKEEAEKEKAEKEKAEKEKAEKEKAEKEKAGKEKAGKEKAGKEKAEKEKAGKEKAKAEKKEKKSDKIEIGFVQARQTGGDEFAEDWFSRSTEDAWEDNMVREAYERSRWMERTIRIGLVAALIVLVIGVFIFTQTYEPEEESEVAVEEERTETSTVNVAEIQERFDRALDRGELIQPRQSSAETALRELRRHAEQTVYEEARLRFVSAADDASYVADERGDLLLARNLSGVAYEFDRNNQELYARAQDIQKRYLASLESTQENAEVAEDGEEVADEGNELLERGTASADTQVAADSSRSAQPARTPQHSNSANPTELFNQARAAEAAQDFNRARELYQQVLSASPSHTEANANLARIYFDVDSDHRSALRHQRRAVESAPSNLAHRVQLGRLHYRLAEYDEAIKAWEQVLERDPNHVEAQRWIGLAQGRMN